VDKGTFGFIVQDSDQDHVFVMPKQCVGFDYNLPPLGARVVFRLVTDPKSGKFRAEDVQPLSEEEEILEGDERTGVMERNKKSFGFIREDITGHDVFVMPASCTGFDSEFPPLGTRVVFTVVRDVKTFKLRADDVRAEDVAQEVHHRPSKELVNEVKAVQKRSPDVRKFWRRFCDDHGRKGVYNPAKHDADFLEQFLSQVQGEEGAEEPPAEPGSEDEVEAKTRAEATAEVICGSPGRGNQRTEEEEQENARKEAEMFASEEEQEQERERKEQEEAEAPAEEEPPAAREPPRPPPPPAPERPQEEQDKEEDEGPADGLVAQALEAQEECPGVWNAFCDREGGGERDPRKHTPQLLQHFLDDIYFYIRCGGGAGSGKRRRSPERKDGEEEHEAPSRARHR